MGLLEIFFLAFLISTSAALADAHFDHQLVMLPDFQYQQYEKLFKDPLIEAEIGARWTDDPSGSNMKGFLYFEDNTYLEIWNAHHSPPVGYQEAYRIENRWQFDQMAALYGKRPLEVPGAFSVFGLYTGVSGQPFGGSGNPFGGLFYIWYPNVPQRQRSSMQKGIVRITKSVPVGAFEELFGEYNKAGLSINCSTLLSMSDSLVATDSFGLVRKVVRAPLGSPGDLLSVEFTRYGNSRLQTPSLQLGPGTGKIIFH